MMKVFNTFLLSIALSIAAFAQTQQLRVGKLTASQELNLTAGSTQYVNVTTSSPGLKMTNNMAATEYRGLNLTVPSGANTNGVGYLMGEFTNTGSSRKNMVGRFGYNALYSFGDHSIAQVIENYYNPTTNGQAEWYIEYISSDRSTVRRPIFFTIPVEGGSAHRVSMQISAQVFNWTADTSVTGLVQHYFGGDALLWAGANGVTPSNFYMRSFDSSGNVVDWRNAGNSIQLQVNGGASTFTITPSTGVVQIASLKTTGSAGSKKVVCVDTATGQLYASSTGTDCSN